MPTPEHAVGTPCWIDLMTSDADASRAFYRELFGWQSEEPSAEFGGYFMFTKDGVPVAGGMPKPDEVPAPDTWSVYIATADAAKTLEMAAAAKGTVNVAAMPVADLGTMAYIGDPAGGQIGIWQPGTFPGYGLAAQPGSVGWFELETRDYEAARAFYTEVFGWDAKPISERPGQRYATFGPGEQEVAGLSEMTDLLTPETPAQWFVYFAVEDTDAALSQVPELGGTVLSAAEDTPYGRLASAADPTGVRFKLVAGNAG